jgi:hypothetical protein
LAIDEDSVAQNSIDLPHASGPISDDLTRDLSLTTPLCEDTTKGFTESRTVLQLATSEKHLVSDITSTEIQIIDDMQKVRTIVEEIQKSEYTSPSGVYKELNELLVFKWPKFS